MRGEFSMKSDVYSFGVLILEIISGKKNSNFNESEGAEDLLSYVSTKLVHIFFFFFFCIFNAKCRSRRKSLTYNLMQAWIHWRDSRPLELLDQSLGDSYSRDEVLRCIHIGLLCVQEDPADRPTMASILLTFNKGSVTLPSPQEPAFFLHSKTDMPIKDLEFDQSTSKSIPWSINEASISELHPR
jgi:serine/threonine protein kinase